MYTFWHNQAMPDCPANRDYVKRQAVRFREGGTPPDFPPNHSEKKFDDRAHESDLTDMGRRMHGLDDVAEDDSHAEL